MPDGARARLRGGPEGSTSWAYVSAAGELVFECYDYGEEATAHFGTDVAFLVFVDAASKPRVFGLLGGEGACSDGALLDLVEARFASYFDAKAWLEAEGVPFRHDFDSWA